MTQAKRSWDLDSIYIQQRNLFSVVLRIRSGSIYLDFSLVSQTCKGFDQPLAVDTQILGRARD